jgi:uncharacterized membrane protein YkvI
MKSFPKGKAMPNKGISALQIAATYIGTVVGAGFATGREILVFFTVFGGGGLAGIGVATVLFVAFGLIIMEIGSASSARSHREIIRLACGRRLGTFADLLITFFLFSALTAMFAGTGALFTQLHGLPTMMGGLAMAVLVGLTVLAGLSGVVKANAAAVPLLMVTVCVTCVLTLLASRTGIAFFAGTARPGGLVGNWPMTAVVYASYNLVMATAVLGPLGAQARNMSAIRCGALLGGLGLGLGSLAINLSLNGNLAAVRSIDVPMLLIAASISPLWQSAYLCAIIAVIYTTAAGSLFGLVGRLTKPGQWRRTRTVVVLICIAALAMSSIGFANLVRLLYPLIGYGGIVLLAWLVLFYARMHSAFVDKKRYG